MTPDLDDTAVQDDLIARKGCLWVVWRCFATIPAAFRWACENADERGDR